VSGGSDPEPLLTRLRWSAHLAVQAPLQPRFPFRSPRAIERAQRRRVTAMVDYAYRCVPYYRETMDRLGLRPPDVRAADDLAKLPTIEREQLQRDPERFVSRAWPTARLSEHRSGGTSGEPLSVQHDPFTAVEAACHRERLRAALVGPARWPLPMREFSIVSPSFDLSGRHPRSAKRGLVPSRVRVVRERMSMLDPLDAVVDRMNEFKPDTVGSYGSYLEALFLHLHRGGRPFHRPRAVIYGSDALSEPVRRLITETYRIRVVGMYQAIEAPNIGFECGRGTGYHLNVDFCPVRIVNSEGADVPDGESGAVVVSNLVTRGTVLLNYRLGDLATKLASNCPCGRTLPLLSYLEGRTDDWLESASGERIHPQAVRTLFTPEEQVWRYQVRQRDPAAFDVAAVVDDGCDRDALRARLATRFIERFGEGTTIDVAFVDSMPRTPGGKVRRVVSAPVSARGGAASQVPP
jgi:phenylacetate-CoA ligase